MPYYKFSKDDRGWVQNVKEEGSEKQKELYKETEDTVEEQYPDLSEDRQKKIQYSIMEGASTEKGGYEPEKESKNTQKVVAEYTGYYKIATGVGLDSSEQSFNSYNSYNSYNQDENSDNGYLVSKTYSVVSPESLEIGEAEETGFDYQDSYYDSIAEVVHALQQEGATGGEWSSSHYSPGHAIWLESGDPDQDISTGVYTYYNWHFNKANGKNLDQDEIMALSEGLNVTPPQFDDNSSSMNVNTQNNSGKGVGGAMGVGTTGGFPSPQSRSTPGPIPKGTSNIAAIL